jgi:hypothetical protein
MKGEVFAYVGHPRNLKDLKDTILYTGGPVVIRKEAWSFYKTSSGVRLCWELEEPKEPKKDRTISGVRLCWNLAEPKGPQGQKIAPKGSKKDRSHFQTFVLEAIA